VSGDTADPGDPGVVFAAWARCRGRGPGLNECRFAFVFTATEKLLIVVEGIVEKKKTSKRYVKQNTGTKWLALRSLGGSSRCLATRTPIWKFKVAVQDLHTKIQVQHSASKERRHNEVCVCGRAKRSITSKESMFL